MKGFIEAVLSIIVVILVLQVLFPQLLQSMIETTLTAIFVSVICLIIGGVIWFLANKN